MNKSKPRLLSYLAQKRRFQLFSGIFSLRTFSGVFLGAEPEFYTQNVFRDTFDKNSHPPKFTPRWPKSENLKNRDFEVAISPSQQNIFANGFLNQKELSKISRLGYLNS